MDDPFPHRRDTLLIGSGKKLPGAHIMMIYNDLLSLPEGSSHIFAATCHAIVIAIANPCRTHSSPSFTMSKPKMVNRH